MPADRLHPRLWDSVSCAVSACRISAGLSTPAWLGSSAKRLARKVRQFQPALACRGSQHAGSGSLQSDTWGKSRSSG